MPRTHYDNLKVSRDAPVGVIHAAFRVLAAKYHPDVNPGDEKAAGIFRIVSRSHEVLSDPVKRAEHDRWIAEVETPSVTTPPIFQVGEKRPVNKWIVGGCVFGMAVLIAITTSIYGLHGSPTSAPMPTAVAPPPKTQQPVEFKSDEVEVTPAIVLHAVPAPEPKMYVAVPKITQQPLRVAPYHRSELDPYGNPWPTMSSYIAAQSMADGEAMLTVDNTRNSSDMLVKLCDSRVRRCDQIRVFFLRAGDRFALENLRSGDYDIRYRNLDSGETRKSKAFNLEDDRERASDASLTLYTVVNGNARSQVIGPDEF